ncbi:MAG: GIY-YIG nuclease family protein [Nitrospiraceae bacterium]|nr:GIY-YIG nuclease family protein [Nitrospirota bacterium]MDA8340587.1 GIY-YIG nuclease family protein [Nitrospiraceae bacterium]
MEMEDKFGYHQDLKNGDGIIRARTTGHLRSWDIPRTMQALEVIKKEWGHLEYPGVYILFDTGGKKVYIGEAKDIYNRLKTHLNSPEDKIKDWNRAVIINDGRSAMQSDFNDSVIRRSLELYLISLFKANRYTVVAQGEPQKHNPQQKSTVQAFKEEFNFLLMKKNFITKLIDKPGQEEILRDDLKKILEKQGYKLSKWSAYEAVINGEKTYIRPGSKKQKGWQITFRDKFKDTLQKGEGTLLVPRDGILFIPFREIQKVITDSSKYKQNTIDIYINFKEESIELTYSDNTIDVTQFRLIK